MFINSELLYFVFLYWLTRGKIIEGLQDFQGMGIVSLISSSWLLVPEYTLYTVQLNGTQELLNKWLLDIGYTLKLNRAQVTWNPNYSLTAFPATSFLLSFPRVVVLFYVSTLEYKARWSIFCLLSHHMTSLRLNAGLKITAGQRTISGQNCNLPGQKIQSPPDMLTGHASTLVQKKTAKSSPANLKFCFFEKTQLCSQSKNYKRIS